MGPVSKKKLALSIDSWKFLEDVSPVSHQDLTLAPEISEISETLRLKQQLKKELEKRSEISSSLSQLETRASRVLETAIEVEEISDHLIKTREILRKVGELSLEFPGSVRSEIVSLCASVGVSVGPCIQVAGWQGLPRVRVFEEELELCFQLCSEDGVVRGAEFHRGKLFDQSEISLPIALLPGDATQCMIKICEVGNQEVIGYSEKIDVDKLFAEGQKKLKLFKNNVFLVDAELVVRAQGISDHDFMVKIRDLEVAVQVDPDSLVLAVFSGEREIKKFPLNRMNEKDIGKIKEGSQLAFRLFVHENIFAVGSVLALTENSDCPLKDSSGNLAGRVVLDIRKIHN